MTATRKNRTPQTLLQEKLFALQDETYGRFNARLIPNIDADTIIGVRIPVLRKLVQGLDKKKTLGDAIPFTCEMREAFLKNLPHRYYEENLIHMMLIDAMDDLAETTDALETFLPYIDNWAVCDCGVPKVFRKNKDLIYVKAKDWLRDSHPYTVRYGIGVMMQLFLDSDFEPAVLESVAALRSEEYYVNMMIAWFFATALAKQEEATLPYFEEQKLDAWTHNKAIQKAVESERISDALKAYLKTKKVVKPKKGANAKNVKKNARHSKGLKQE